MEQWEKDEPYIIEHYKKHGIDVTEDVDLPEDGVLYIVQADGSLKDSRKLSGKEKKYGVNEWPNLVMCPRCCEAVPVRVEGNKLFCRKCETLGHVDGALIKEVKDDPVI